MQITEEIFDLQRHYWDVCAWWVFHNWKPIAPALLSSYGVVVQVDGINAAAGWLYLSNSKWAFIEFIVTNPSVSMKSRLKAVKYLVDRLSKEAGSFGAFQIFSSLESPGLIRIYEKLGFVRAGEGMTNMVMKCQ